MNPPPSTPTPRRFLIAKRGTQSSQTPTQPPRFQSTPRFGSSSGVKAGSSSAIKVGLSSGRKERDLEDVEDVEDEDDFDVDDLDDVDVEGMDDRVDESESEVGGEPRRGVPLNDSIEVESESDDVTASQGLSVDALDEDVEEDEMDVEDESPRSTSPWEESSPIQEREAKRRRVTISPLRESSPPEEDESQPDPDGTPLPAHIPNGDSLESIDDIRPGQALQQPTFRAPPRFKPIEDDFTEGLPAAFSPQRRGAKYLPTGLAASLQGWLSEVKGWDGPPEDAGGTTITVEEVRPGRRMYLVKAAGQGFMLAGEGRLTGLGRRAVVGVGSRVCVGLPVWDVVLEGERWTVACDWSVI